MKKETIQLTTIDGLHLTGNYYPGKTQNAVICLHQYKADKSTYEFLATELQDKGYHVLAIDLRGHGDSDGNYENFNETDFQSMFNDARAADEYLKTIDPEMSVQMIGASIGANTALIYQEMNTLESVVALSPGLNYHGIDPTNSNLGNIAMPIFYINSENDTYVEETKQLYEDSPVTGDGINKMKIYPGEKHGVYILQENETAKNEVISWLDTHAGKGLAIFKDISSIQ